MRCDVSYRLYECDDVDHDLLSVLLVALPLRTTRMMNACLEKGLIFGWTGLLCNWMEANGNGKQTIVALVAASFRAITVDA